VVGQPAAALPLPAPLTSTRHHRSGATPRPASKDRPSTAQDLNRISAPRIEAKEHRRSYARRTSAERTFATIKDPAATSIARGWCRLMGVTPLSLWLACLLAVRNQRILDAYHARQADNDKRAAAGLPPRTRKRRRTTLASLAAAPP
jgi:hypothetical protein